MTAGSEAQGMRKRSKSSAAGNSGRQNYCRGRADPGNRDRKMNLLGRFQLRPFRQPRVRKRRTVRRRISIGTRKCPYPRHGCPCTAIVAERRVRGSVQARCHIFDERLRTSARDLGCTAWPPAVLPRVEVACVTAQRTTPAQLPAHFERLTAKHYSRFSSGTEFLLAFSS